MWGQVVGQMGRVEQVLDGEGDRWADRGTGGQVGEGTGGEGGQVGEEEQVGGGQGRQAGSRYSVTVGEGYTLQTCLTHQMSEV